MNTSRSQRILDEKLVLLFLLLPVLFTASGIAYTQSADLSLGDTGWLLLAVAVADLAVNAAALRLQQRAAAGFSLVAAALLLPLALYYIFHHQQFDLGSVLFGESTSPWADRAALLAALSASAVICLAMLKLTSSERWTLPGFIYLGLAAPLVFPDFLTNPQQNKYAVTIAVVAVLALLSAQYLPRWYNNGARSSAAASGLLLVYAFVLLDGPHGATARAFAAAGLLIVTAAIARYYTSVPTLLATLIALIIFSSAMAEDSLQTASLILLIMTTILTAITAVLLVQRRKTAPPDSEETHLPT